MIAVRDVVLLGHRTVGLDEDSAAELARIPEQLRRLDAVALVADSGARAGPLLTGSPTPARGCGCTWIWTPSIRRRCPP